MQSSKILLKCFTSYLHFYESLNGAVDSINFFFLLWRVRNFPLLQWHVYTEITNISFYPWVSLHHYTSWCMRFKHKKVNCDPPLSKCITPKRKYKTFKGFQLRNFQFLSTLYALLLCRRKITLTKTQHNLSLFACGTGNLTRIVSGKQKFRLEIKE